MITPSSLHYIATTRGAFLPEIDPKQHTLTVHGTVKGSATWFVPEGAEEIEGASSMPIAKAMDDVLVAYGMNDEPVRPQQGFPLRLVVPGFEGIFNTKWAGSK